jgi:hypothetical protein
MYNLPKFGVEIPSANSAPKVRRSPAPEIKELVLSTALSGALQIPPGCTQHATRWLRRRTVTTAEITLKNVLQAEGDDERSSIRNCWSIEIRRQINTADEVIVSRVLTVTTHTRQAF